MKEKFFMRKKLSREVSPLALPWPSPGHPLQEGQKGPYRFPFPGFSLWKSQRVITTHPPLALPFWNSLGVFTTLENDLDYLIQIS